MMHQKMASLNMRIPEFLYKCIKKVSVSVLVILIMVSNINYDFQKMSNSVALFEK